MIKIEKESWRIRRYLIDADKLGLKKLKGGTGLPAPRLITNPYCVDSLGIVQNLGPKRAAFIRRIITIPGIEIVTVDNDTITIGKSLWRGWKGIEPYILKGIKETLYPQEPIPGIVHF